MTVGELFCGAGGLALGLKNSGFKSLWGVDSDRYACMTYARNIGADAITSKVEDVDFSRLDKPDGLAFGFPCNDFSVVGEKKGLNGYYGNLYKETVRAMDEIQPDWFIAENVPGIMSQGGSTILEKFSLSGKKYNVSIHTFRFEDYGVPQRRWRIIAVGIRADWNFKFMPPVPTHKIPRSCEEALLGVECVPYNNEIPKHTDRVVELLSHIPEGGNAWHSNIPEYLRLKVANCRLSLIYRKLKRNEPSSTVVASGGGGTHMYHWSEPRALTNRERARLQTFPDSFVFEGLKGAVRRQIGMAIPPLAGEIIGNALAMTLKGKAYPCLQPSEGFILSDSPDISAVSLERGAVCY